MAIAVCEYPDGSGKKSQYVTVNIAWGEGSRAFRCFDAT